MTIPKIWGNPLRDPQRIPPAAWCRACRAELYPGEGQTLCPRCQAEAAANTEEELRQRHDLT